MMFIYPMWLIPPIPTDCDLPPTLYAMLNSIVNFGKDDKTKIEDLASAGRTTIFNFNYPLSSKVNKKDFEEMILNHFIMRRLGYETYNAWHIALKVKMNEIMPMYNKLFDCLEGWDLFKDGEVISRTTNTSTSDTTTASNNVVSTSSASNVSDRRFSDTPQNELQDIKDGKYITEYNYDSDKSSSTIDTSGINDSTTDGTRDEVETITRSPYDKMTLYRQYLESLNSIYSMIFKDLDCLFYQLV